MYAGYGKMAVEVLCRYQTACRGWNWSKIGMDCGIWSLHVRFLCNASAREAGKEGGAGLTELGKGGCRMERRSPLTIVEAGIYE